MSPAAKDEEDRGGGRPRRDPIRRPTDQATDAEGEKSCIATNAKQDRDGRAGRGGGGNRSFSLSVLLASSQTDGRTDDNADMTPLNPTKKLLMVATFFFGLLADRSMLSMRSESGEEDRG